MCKECGESSAGQGSSPGAGSVAKAIGHINNQALQESRKDQEDCDEDPRQFSFSRVDDPAVAAHNRFERQSRFSDTPRGTSYDLGRGSRLSHKVLGVETPEETQRRRLRKRRAAITAIQNSMEHRVLVAEQDLEGA